MYIQTQKLNQQANKLTIDCTRHIFKHATKCKRETSKKKYTTKLARTKPKKDEQTQGKKPTQKKNLF